MQVDRAARRDRMLRWIETQGVIPCYDPQALELLRGLLRSVGPFFWTELTETQTVLFYTYRQDEQLTPELREQDGLAWRNVTSDCGNLHAIGLSVELLEQGTEQATAVFLHELAHIVSQADHNDPLFETTLTELSNWYAQAQEGVEIATTPARASCNESPTFVRTIPLSKKRRLADVFKVIFSRGGESDE